MMIVLIAFILAAIVVFIVFRSLLPSFAVIFGEVVGDAGDAAVHVCAAEGFFVDHFTGGHFDEGGAGEEATGAADIVREDVS